MTTRIAGIVVILTALSISLICLRRATLSASAEIEGLRRDQIALRREAWTLQAQIAAQRTPQAIHGRVREWQLNVSAPSESPSPWADSVLVDARR